MAIIQLIHEIITRDFVFFFLKKKINTFGVRTRLENLYYLCYLASVYIPGNSTSPAPKAEANREKPPTVICLYWDLLISWFLC